MATTVPDPPTARSDSGVTTPKAPDQRREDLGRAVQRQISRGDRVESRGDYQAILVTAHRPNRLLHIVTFGLWGGERRTLLSVDESGNTSIKKLSR
jgi:hypothetical protein